MPDEARLAVKMIKLGFRKTIVLSEIPSLSSSGFVFIKREAGLDGEDSEDKRLRRLKKINRILFEDDVKKRLTFPLCLFINSLES